MSTVPTELVVDILMALPWKRMYVLEQDSRYSAYVEELDGCFSSGDTLEEAKTNLEEAMRLWFTGELEAQNEIPAPPGPAYSTTLVQYRVT